MSQPNLKIVGMVSETATSSILKLRSSIDMSDLSEMQIMQLKFRLDQFYSSRDRFERELLLLTTQLVQIKEILGSERFYKFAAEELQISPATARRYIIANQCLVKHFATDGKISPRIASKMSIHVLGVLADVSDADVIDEVKRVAESGEKVTESVIKKIIDSRTSQIESELAIANADRDSLALQLEQTKRHADADMARNKLKLQNLSQLIERKEKMVDAAQEELDNMHSRIKQLEQQAIEVKIEEKFVDTIPAGYTNILEAIDSKKAELESAKLEKIKLDKEIAELQEKKQSAAALSAIEQNKSDCEQFHRTIESILKKYPVAKLKSLVKTEPAIQTLLDSTGQLLIQFGQQLTADTAK